MFTLNQEELNALNANRTGRGGIRYFPNTFTESGVAMLSSVLNSMDKLEQSSTKLFKIVFERLDSVEEIIESRLPGNRKKIGIKIR